jgi:hypothetical protein
MIISKVKILTLFKIIRYFLFEKYFLPNAILLFICLWIKNFLAILNIACSFVSNIYFKKYKYSK